MKIKQQIVTDESSRSLRRFANSINSPFTEQTYVNNLKGYMEYHNIKDFDDLLTIDKEKTFEMIEDYIEYNRKKKQRSNSRINGILCAIRLFYSANRYDELNWYILARFKGKERKKMVNDRSYSRAEIKKMLEYADVRMKVAILLMTSSGIRVGGLASITYKDLQYIEQYKLYKIRIYSDDLTDSYFTFCTPECAKFIDLYLEERKRQYGEDLKPDSPLIRKDMDCFTDLKLTPHSIGERIRRINIAAGIKASQSIKEGDNPIEVRRQRHQIMTCHGFRKFFNTICVDSDMKHLAKEILMGHKREQGLDRNYYTPISDSTLLQEYLKVVDDLTIDPSHRLQKQVQELKEQDDYQKYVIDKKMKEKDEQIKALQDSINFLSDTVNRALLADPENKIITAPESDGKMIVKGIELKPEINNKISGNVIPKET
jgi:integrase